MGRPPLRPSSLARMGCYMVRQPPAAVAVRPTARSSLSDPRRQSARRFPAPGWKPYSTVSRAVWIRGRRKALLSSINRAICTVRLLVFTFVVSALRGVTVMAPFGKGAVDHWYQLDDRDGPGDRQSADRRDGTGAVTRRRGPAVV